MPDLFSKFVTWICAHTGLPVSEQLMDQLNLLNQLELHCVFMLSRTSDTNSRQHQFTVHKSLPRELIRYSRTTRLPETVHVEQGFPMPSNNIKWVQLFCCFPNMEQLLCETKSEGIAIYPCSTPQLSSKNVHPPPPRSNYYLHFMVMAIDEYHSL